MSVDADGIGVFGAVVWPTYLGLTMGAPGPPGRAPDNEPFGDIDYQRGQIWWTQFPDGDILGSARIYVPKGAYTHLIFCHGPLRHMFIGHDPCKHPLVFDRAGMIDIEPIRNKDYLPRTNGLPRRPE